MLTIPWFVTKTFQDLFRRTPVPLENQQQQQLLQQERQQRHHQQQQPPPVGQTQAQQQQEPVRQQVQQQQEAVRQTQAQQQQEPVRQTQARQQQEAVKQTQAQQQQEAVRQTQAQQHQSQQKQTITSPHAQTTQVHNDLAQQTASREQNLPPSKRPVPEVSADSILAKKASPQHTAPAVIEVHSATTSQLSEATPTVSLKPAADSSIQTSSRTVVLRDSASGGRMSFEWAQKQVEKFQFDFDQADKDKSGSLSFQEVYDVLQNVGFKGTKEEAQFIFGHLDRDKDQKITREEFKATLSNLPRLSIKEFVLRKTFLKLDKDGSGYLTRAEIADATKSEAGLDIGAEKISDLLIYLAKEDKDEKVSYEEFLYVFGVESAATVLRQVFAKLDTDGSGFLTKEEILDAVKAESELKLKADKISDLLIYWCKDKDKKISYNEFVDVWLKQKEAKPKK